MDQFGEQTYKERVQLQLALLIDLKTEMNNTEVTQKKINRGKQITRLQKQNHFQFEEKEFMPATSELQKTLQDTEYIVDHNEIMGELGISNELGETC